MTSQRLTLITLIGLTLVCLLVGGVGGAVLFHKVRESKFRMQIENNKAYGERFSAALEAQLAMGIEPEFVLDYLQASFEASESAVGERERYICLLSDDGGVLCHPNAGSVGQDASALSLSDLENGEVMSYRDWAAEGRTGALVIGDEGKPREIVQRLQVAGAPWNILVHTDLGVVEREIQSMNRLILMVLVPMGLALVLIGTLVVRSIGKRYEDAIIAANRDLEGRVAERTEKLQETIGELQQTQEALATSEKMALLGQLMAGIAHEIRNPLGAIALFAGTLEDSAETEQDRELVEKILLSAERCDLLVRNLLAFARNDTPEIRSVRVGDLVDTALGFVISDLKDPRIQFEKRLDDANPSILVDRIQIEQVLLNLVTNAIAELRSQEHEGRIRLSTELEKERIRFIVEDSGRGIPDEILATLFEPFHTTKPEGTGLGLSLCRRFVERHNGTITYDHSPELGGARFTVELPRPKPKFQRPEEEFTPAFIG